MNYFKTGDTIAPKLRSLRFEVTTRSAIRTGNINYSDFNDFHLTEQDKYPVGVPNFIVHRVFIVGDKTFLILRHKTRSTRQDILWDAKQFSLENERIYNLIGYVSDKSKTIRTNSSNSNNSSNSIYSMYTIDIEPDIGIDLSTCEKGTLMLTSKERYCSYVRSAPSSKTYNHLVRFESGYDAYCTNDGFFDSDKKKGSERIIKIY